MSVFSSVRISIIGALLALLGPATSSIAQEGSPPPEGTEVVLAAQRQPLQYEPEMTASDQIEAYMGKKEWYEGWDDEKKRFFVLEMLSFNTKNPKDPQESAFLTKREVLARQAVINAKVQIIEFLNTEMSAEEKITIPGTDVHAELNARFEAARQKILDQKAVVAKMMQQLDAAEAADLEGVTTMDRLPELMDAVIKKLDDSYDSGEIAADKRQRFEEAKANYAQASAELTELQAEADAMGDQVQSEFSSSIETLASMPLFGSTVIAQAESYTAATEQYEIAILFVWSAALENAARATLLGTAANSNANAKKKSLQAWLASQDLSVMVGPRQYLDDQGRRFFLGIASRPQGKNSAASRKARKLADMNAKAMTAFSLRSDIEAHSKATLLAQELGSTDMNEASRMEVAESLAEEISGTINASIRGLGKVSSKKTVHPISGQDIYVSVFAVTPDAAQASLGAEMRSYATATEVNKKMQFERGRKEGMQAETEAARTDEASYRAGVATGQSDVRQRVQGREAAAANAPQPGATNPSATATPAVEGSFMSGDDADDDF
jgi:hypothetical protein